MSKSTTHCDKTIKLSSRFRHPSFLTTGMHGVLHPLKSNTVLIFMDFFHKAEISVCGFADPSWPEIYKLKIYKEDYEGQEEVILSIDDTDWSKLRSKIIELKKLI